MKELQIIIKTPYDGNPLNQEIGRGPIEGRMTVGWKMFADDGQIYGNYIDMPFSENLDEIKQAVNILINQAHITDMMVILGEKEEAKDAEALR